MEKQMEKHMWRVAIGAAVGVMLAACMAMAAETADEAAPECRKAEINPVTGHVLCIDPRGAPVAPPPEDIAPPCEAQESRGQWSWAPPCKDAPKDGASD